MVYAFDATDGHVMASVSLGSVLYSSAAIFGPKSFEADATGMVVAFTVAAPASTGLQRIRSVTGRHA